MTASSSKRPKKGPTWIDVKNKVAPFDKAGLMGLISDLYALNRENRAFLHARFGLEGDPLQSYKKRIRLAIAPEITARRFSDPSVTAARKAISEYKKAVGDPPGLLELRVFWCETAVDFSMDFGYADESYFSALERQYRDACFTLLEIDEPARSEYLNRLRRVRDNARVGYGVQDLMNDWLLEVLDQLPQIPEAPLISDPDED